MRASWKFGMASVVFGYFAACSPVKFEKLSDAQVPTPPVVVTCQGAECIQSYTVERRVGQGLVDVLIINDNSGSMSAEQRKMAVGFQDFLTSLGPLDYRIAMTTTDVSYHFSQVPVSPKNYPGPFNGNGAYQDGNLLEFAPGIKYLTKSTTAAQSLFNATVQRRETLDCESSNYNNCPSGDERGVFAANLVLDRTASEFIRPTAHLAVIILSDEDERGLSDQRSVMNSTDQQLKNLYPLENYDLPETFISRFKQRYPDKTLSVHSIIVKPGDAGCLSQQTDPNNRNIRGVEGFTYAKLTQLTGGVLGSICDSQNGGYSNQLQNIGYSIQDQVTSLPFSCRPIDDDFDVTFEPSPSHDVNVTADFGKMELTINGTLAPLTKVRLTYNCRKQ